MLLRSNFVSEPRTRIVAAAIIIAVMAAAFSTASQAADLKVSFADAVWDGKKVPKGQQCSKFGGNGATPALNVENIPAGANAIIVEFNDRSYQPLSYDGGHGKIGYWIEEGSTSAMLQPEIEASADKAVMVRRHRRARIQFQARRRICLKVPLSRSATGRPVTTQGRATCLLALAAAETSTLPR